MIFSFYSFKGGVGRTQLLANIASYLCYYRDYKILIIDWDMEAPGCHYFFTDKDNPITFDKDGVLETFQAYCDLVREKGNDAKPEERPYFTKEKNVYELKKSASGKGVIDLIPAGNYSKEFDFYQQASEFDWIEFHQRLGGKNYLEYIKKQLKNKELGFDYDFIFIDSRTGISDYTNMVNIQMSECDVLVMAPNDQNFEGCRLMAERIKKSPYVTKRSEAKTDEQVYRYDYILPVLSRWDKNANDADKWIEKFYNYFSPLLRNISHHDITSDFKTFDSDYIKNTILEYNFSTSVGEHIFFTKETTPFGESSLKQNFENIAYYLISIRNKADRVDFRSLKREVKQPSDKSTLRSYMILANTWENLGDYQQAEVYYRKAIQLAPNDYRTWNGLGVVSTNLLKYKEAIDAYQKSIELNANDDAVWSNLADVYFDKKEYNKAIEIYEKSIAINNHNSITWHNLGCAYLQQREYNKAQECFDKSLEINPNDEGTIFNLACTHSLQQNKKQALSYLKKAIKLEVENKQKAKTDKDFEWLWQDADFQALVGE